MENLRFNRDERSGRHLYIDGFEADQVRDEARYEGFVKCKLVHAEHYSVLFPDQIYFVAGQKLFWLQPFYFAGNLISRTHERDQCELWVDISSGPRIGIIFSATDVVSWLNDGSVLYRCTISGPKYLYRYRTGRAKIVDGKPYVKLFHHTTPTAKRSIEKSREYWTSRWNIQGTKKSVNIGYLYLTSLPTISNVDDLTQIAMSSYGQLWARLDDNKTGTPDLVLKVYRESTDNRTQTLSHWVNAELLSPQPSYRHRIFDSPGYHEIVCPFVHRVGVEPDTNVSIEEEGLVPNSPKRIDFAVIGDATTVSGLIAPYDEEETDERFLIEALNDPEELIQFWIENANTNQTGNKRVEDIKFEK